MIQGIFDAITSIVNAFVGVLTNLFEKVVALIWTPGTGNDPGSLTVVGTLLLIALGTGLVMWGFYFIRSLIRVRRG